MWSTRPSGPLAVVLQRPAHYLVKERCANAAMRLQIRLQSTTQFPPTLKLLDKVYATDSWTNVTPSIASYLGRNLHLSPDHPLALTRELITSRLPSSRFTHYAAEFPSVVSTTENFDTLGFPADHPGRSRNDTYYVNSETCLRTHTSAHEVQAFRGSPTDGYTIAADVYRRDTIDRSHYPAFHQMEGALTWDRRVHGSGDQLAAAVLEDAQRLARTDVVVVEDAPPFHAERNPIQPGHGPEEVLALTTHLKRSLEDVVAELFSAASKAAGAPAQDANQEPLRIRWVEAYFPFTSPSFELEVFWQGDWLELLGCGVSKQPVLDAAGQSHRSGWAFGIGLERIAMLLYGIPDIRLFWSTDSRFLSQFGRNKPLRRFAPFSSYPPCYKDVSFWVPDARVEPAGAAAAGGVSDYVPPDTAGETPVSFHENDLMELVREVAGDLVEDVVLTDEFTHPRTLRRSLCYRVNYRSHTETLTNERTNALHEKLTQAMVQRLGVEVR